MDDLNKVVNEEASQGANFGAAGVSTKYLEGWINEKLNMAAKHNFPMAIRRPEHMKPLERHDLSRI